jgi:AcrR family transcriptional regulator
MQKKKDHTYKSILAVAKDEFIKNGYRNTSMRVISKKSSIGLSNIYNYFRNKNEIYLAVLNPLLSFIDTLYESHNDLENISIDIFYSKTYQQESIKTMVSLVENFRYELRLLLFHSYGSSLENFRGQYSHKYTEVSLDFLKNIKSKHPHINTQISPFFLHTLSSWMFTIIGEIVTHDELTHQEIEEFMADYIAFGTSGWKTILKV